MTAKEVAIRRITVFMYDRVSYAVSTRDRQHTTQEAIEKMLKNELSDVPDGPEVPNG